MTGTETILAAKGVCKSFRINRGLFGQSATLKAVDQVSLELKRGQSLGLLGESGCGKSTLGRIVCGLEMADAGEINFLGKPLPPAGARSWAAGKIQMIFQDPASSLDPRMTIQASVQEPLLRFSESARERMEKAEELLEAVGLPGMGKRYPHQFSGGQRQRIAVARALVTRPDLVICDEPVSALDASVQAQILNLLKDMQTQYQPAYLFISHDLAVVGFMCLRILVMYLGQLVEKGHRDELFRHAAHPYTRALIAAMPRGERNWKEGRDLSRLPPPLSGELPSPINPPSGCYFHPRCPEAREICAKEVPPWKRMGEGWEARCHFAKPGAPTVII